MKNNLLTLAGAAAGGVVGYFVCVWLVRQGLYALILPGGLLGLGAGFFKSRSLLISILCGVLALALGLYTDWSFEPFVADSSIGYYLSHLQQLRPVTMIMIIVGGGIGFWVPFRRHQDAMREMPADSVKPPG
jgi:hypothetical protein